MRAADQDDFRAKPLGLTDLGEGLDAEGLGLVACRNQRSRVGHGAADADRPPAKLRVDLLFDRRKEAVQVDVQKAEAIVLERRSHRLEYIRRLFAAPERSAERPGDCARRFGGNPTTPEDLQGREARGSIQTQRANDGNERTADGERRRDAA